jgi:uncharacterized protein YcbK (DUF882 family)
MMLTKNISQEEMYCKCNYPDCDMKKPYGSHKALAKSVQDCVDHFSAVMKTPCHVAVNCVNRCKKHNHDVGGEQNSQHMQGRAMDHTIYVEGGGRIEPRLVADYYEKTYPQSCGVGRYQTFTHFDIRERKARW